MRPLLLGMFFLTLLPVQDNSWQRFYSGKGPTGFAAMAWHPDGYVLAAGTTHSINNIESDMLLVALDSLGAPRWEREYGSERKSEAAQALCVDAQGQLLLAGTAGKQGYVLCLQRDLRVRWKQTYGAPADSLVIWAICPWQGGYALAGTRRGQAWAARTDAQGALVWSGVPLGGEQDAALYALCATQGGYLALCGRRQGDFWLGMMDAGGEWVWSERYGSEGEDQLRVVAETPTGDLLFAGQSDDFRAQTASHFVGRWTIEGQRQWERSWGGGRIDRGLCAIGIGPTVCLLGGYAGQEAQVLRCSMDGKLLGYDSFAVGDTAIAGRVQGLCTSPSGQVYVAGRQDSQPARGFVSRRP
ncbi:MAG: hypothetical protein OHK0039_44800 [Bacteroidia bacterium]